MLSCLASEPDARPRGADDLRLALREFLKPADLGDVARRLGDRVQRTRAHALAGPVKRAERTGSPSLALETPTPRRLRHQDVRGARRVDRLVAPGGDTALGAPPERTWHWTGYPSPLLIPAPSLPRHHLSKRRARAAGSLTAGAGALGLGVVDGAQSPPAGVIPRRSSAAPQRRPPAPLSPKRHEFAP